MALAGEEGPVRAGTQSRVEQGVTRNSTAALAAPSAARGLWEGPDLESLTGSGTLV